MPKGMEECDAAIEIGCYAGGTADSEIHRAEFCWNGTPPLAASKRALRVRPRLNQQEYAQRNRL